MDLRLLPVTDENRETALKLDVAEDQKDFIEPVDESLRDAEKLPGWNAVCIYDGEVMIGFAMYGRITEDEGPQVWFDRLMIDSGYQHRGYGKKAFGMIIDLLSETFPGEDIYLSVCEENRVAYSMYSSFGFRVNGDIDDKGETIMVLE